MKLTINFAITAEQVLAPDFKDKMKLLDRAEVSAYWLYGFYCGHIRNMDNMIAAKAILEEYGKEAYVCCEPVGHPATPTGSDDPSIKERLGNGWKYRVGMNGDLEYFSADIDGAMINDHVAAAKAFRKAGFKKVFYDDDLRLGNWGETIRGCFCDECVARFNASYHEDCNREVLREIVLNPGKFPKESESWIEYNCSKVTNFMKAVNLPGAQVGIMVMHNGDRRHGVDIPVILREIPDCLIRVGEMMFNDSAFDPPEGKASLIQSLERHKVLVGDVSRLYSENTVHPWPMLRPENMAKKLCIEVEHGLRNIMLMPPTLLDAPTYWEEIIKVLPYAKNIAGN